MSPYLDAFRVDIKSFSEDFYRKTCGARLALVLESTKNDSNLHDSIPCIKWMTFIQLL